MADYGPPLVDFSPLAVPLNVSGAVRLDSALATAQASGLAPTTTNPNFLPGRLQTWNVNVERQFGDTGVMVGYFGSHGDRLRVPVNINQFILGTATRPFPALSTSSPILPGAARQHHRSRERRLVQLQGPLADGEPADVQGAPARRLVHVVEIRGHELL